LDEEFNTRAKSDLGFLMRSVGRKLPRELRDIIYKHLCVYPEPILLSKKVGPAAERNASGLYQDNALLKPSYIREPEAMELHEAYWSQNTSEINVGLRDGYWGLDKPICTAGHYVGEVWIDAYRHIRHVRVHVDTHSKLGPQNYDSVRAGFIEDTSLGQLGMVIIHS
jgi:hypothetical protein